MSKLFLVGGALVVAALAPAAASADEDIAPGETHFAAVLAVPGGRAVQR